MRKASSSSFSRKPDCALRQPCARPVLLTGDRTTRSGRSQRINNSEQENAKHNGELVKRLPSPLGMSQKKLLEDSFAGSGVVNDVQRVRNVHTWCGLRERAPGSAGGASVMLCMKSDAPQRARGELGLRVSQHTSLRRLIRSLLIWISIFS